MILQYNDNLSALNWSSLNPFFEHMATLLHTPDLALTWAGKQPIPPFSRSTELYCRWFYMSSFLDMSRLQRSCSKQTNNRQRSPQKWYIYSTLENQISAQSISQKWNGSWHFHSKLQRFSEFLLALLAF